MKEFKEKNEAVKERIEKIKEEERQVVLKNPCRVSNILKTYGKKTLKALPLVAVASAVAGISFLPSGVFEYISTLTNGNALIADILGFIGIERLPWMTTVGLVSGGVIAKKVSKAANKDIQKQLIQYETSIENPRKASKTAKNIMLFSEHVLPKALIASGVCYGLLVPFSGAFDYFSGMLPYLNADGILKTASLAKVLSVGAVAGNAVKKAYTSVKNALTKEEEAADMREQVRLVVRGELNKVQQNMQEKNEGQEEKIIPFLEPKVKVATHTGKKDGTSFTHSA